MKEELRKDRENAQRKISSKNIIRLITSRILCEGRAECIRKMTNVYTHLVGKHDGRSHLRWLIVDGNITLKSVLQKQV
jgi:hypothetical protein